MRSISQRIWSIKHHPVGVQGYININKIHISKDFLDTTPKVWKVREYYNRYFQNDGCIDKPITVCKNGHSHTFELKDGYIRFLIIKYNIERYQEEFNCTYSQVPNRFKMLPVKFVKE